MSSTPDDKGRKGPGGRPHKGLRIAPSQGDVVPGRGGGRREPPEIDENPSEEDVERFSNVTRECPECGKEVFDDAEVCYHCGHAFERTTAGSGKMPTWVIVTVVAILAAFVLAVIIGVI